MHPHTRTFSQQLAPLALALLALAAAPSALQAQTTSGSGLNIYPAEPVMLNFVGAEIEGVARALSAMSGRPLVVDPRVRGTLNLTSERPVSPTAALNLFAGALRLQGFAMVETAGLFKVVPEADAKLQSGTVSDGPPSALGAARGNQIVTQIFALRHENANNLVPILRPLISPNNTLNVNPGNNSLVITDYVDNLQRINRIIAALDVSNATDVEVIPLKHAVASDIAALTIRLLEGGAGGGGTQPEGAYRSTLLPEPRSNSLVVRAANPARLALIRSIVEKLDRPSSENASGNIHVVYLKNADAVQMAAVLRAALSGEGGGGEGMATRRLSATPMAAAAGSSPSASSGSTSTATAANSSASTGGQIQADPSSNALIITAPDPQFRQLLAVIDKLDGRRAQVFVESLIAEVNADKAAEFGIQWQGGSTRSGNGLIGLIGSNFGSGGNNILNLANGGGDVLPGRGLNAGGVLRRDGVNVLGFLARFLEQNGDANILSTPNLLTIDNEEAKIVIGQNVPFVTGQFTNTGANNGSVNPFQTIERQDVGLTLKVRPQISENGTIKMAIFQEVSSVQASSVNSPSGLITNKRTIESNVLVEDGQIVVLGGLLQDEFANNVEKVPGLGDIPVVGNLFKSQSRSRRKTNLMVFLRPVVLRDAPSTDRFSMDRYDVMRAAQQQTQPEPSRVLGINESPVMPARPAAPVQAQPTEAPKAP